jgi:hypothetical protein
LLITTGNSENPCPLPLLRCQTFSALGARWEERFESAPIHTHRMRGTLVHDWRAKSGNSENCCPNGEMARIFAPLQLQWLPYYTPRSFTRPRLTQPSCPRGSNGWPRSACQPGNRRPHALPDKPSRLPWRGAFPGKIITHPRCGWGGNSENVGPPRRSLPAADNSRTISSLARVLLAGIGFLLAKG